MPHAVVLAPTTMSNNSFLGSGSKKSSIFGSIKKLGRKNSSKSTASTKAMDDKSSAKEPSDLSVPVNAAGSRSRSPSSNPFSTPSPATRRPDGTVMGAFTSSSNKAPPAYSPSPIDGSGPSFANIPKIAPTDDAGDESDYGFLATFDTIILIDDSGSMAGGPWKEVSQALASIAPIVTKYDSDGVDLYFINHKSSDKGDFPNGIAPTAYRGLRRANSIHELMERVRPSGGTMTGVRLNSILRPYLTKCEKELALGNEVKPLNIIVITDGAPSDEPETSIIQAAQRLDRMDAPPFQLGIQFFQVGNERGAKEALERLDDHLANKVPGGIRDIVDTVTWTGGNSASEGGVGLTGDSILKVVLGSVVKRLDRQRAS
ncbi:hypothetical protein HYALB_00009141 [Hymenoscyphus albidus]|uniref:VWFA domain-containing protein n=1 Tax=Hymenoscyphus albidus TaxID=595503 RepID=A0A9N9LN66_9HELO|nr:hypothetical protein HYALB_00009141 [Hymenoscyphus albidus]